MCSTGRTAFISTLMVFMVLTASISVAAPVISNVSAGANTTGTPVTITGSGFGPTQGTNTVKFFGVTAQINSWSDASIVAILPSVANGQATVVVTVGGVASNTAFFAVMNPLTYSLMPSSGVVGTSVTIWGSNFGSSQGISMVTFNGTSSQISSWGNYSIVAVVPTGVPNGNINVKVTVGGIASNTQTFTVSSRPFISMVSMNFGSYSISANSAPVNQDVTINGVNFGTSQGSSTITFNGTSAIASFWGPNAIVATVPTGATTGSVVVTVNGVSSNAVAFMVPPPAQVGGVGFVQGNYSANALAEYTASDILAACYQDSSGMMTSTIQVPFPLEQNAGDLNVVIVSWRDTNVDAQVLGDSANNQYTATGKYSQSGNGQQQIWFAPNIVGGSNIVIVVFASTKGNCLTAPEVRIAEYRGISTNSGWGAVDVNATQNTSSSATCNSGNKTTANQNDLLLGANLAAQTTTTPGSNYANRLVTTPQGDILEDRIVTATGSYNASATMSASGNCLMQMVAFKEATNQAPIVSAGPNQTITLPTNSVFLDGTATDDGLPNNTLTISWSKVSGPGSVTFSSPNIAATNATFTTAGTYVLQLSANDSELQSTATTTITVTSAAVSIMLAPSMVGPDITGTTQTFTATVTQAGTPISGAAIQFTVSGPNATGGLVTTNAIGVATFTYTGTHNGNDTIQAAYNGSVSNVTTLGWITPVQNFSTTTAPAQFFVGDGGCSFDIPVGTKPVFTIPVPTLAFDPPVGWIPGNNTGVTNNTRPFTGLVMDVNGNVIGTIVAQGNGLQAGVGQMTSFQAVFTGTFTVAKSGNVTFNVSSDDGFVFGIGNGATYVSGPLTNPPASNLTAFEGLPVIAAHNVWGFNTWQIVVNFPAPGSYPYEADYVECAGGPLSFAVTAGQTNAIGLPPTGSVSLSPANPAAQNPGQNQTFSVAVTDASGLSVANTPVTLVTKGANQNQFVGSTDSTGHATFQYTGTNAGTDSVQAMVDVSGIATLSNVATMTWNGGSGTCSTFIFTPQGWIGSPAIGATVQGLVPITLVSGITLTSGTLKMFPSGNPNQITVLNPNTTGSGPLTLGTIDGTLLANGEYTIQLQATQSSGSCQINEIVVSVTGDYKPGRKTVTVTDFTVPLAGIPINITRTYDSLNRGKVGDFGNGWNLSTNVQLSVDQLMNVTFTWNGKTQTFYFTPQSAGQALFPWLVLPHYTPQPGLYGSFTSNGCSALIFVGGALVQDSLGVACFPAGSYQPTVYTYTDPSGRVYTMSSTGQLQSIKDLNGNTLTFTQSGITSSVNGAVIPFVRDPQTGRITQITDLNGNSYHYTYDLGGSCPVGGPLCSVTFTGDGSTRGTYIYFSDNSLKTFTDPNGKPSVATYYPDGRLNTFTDANQNQWSYSYNLTTVTTTTTNPDQGVVTRIDDSFGKPLSITEQVTSTISRTTTYTYDANENLHSVTSACGNGTCPDTVGTNHTTVYGYDANGFRTSVQDPLGHTSTKTYNQYGGVRTSTDAANSNTETTTYDANFNPQQVTDLLHGTGTLVGSFTYDTMGNVLTYTDANGKITTYTYYPNGTLYQVFDPLNEITSFTYDSMNRPLTKKDPLGHVTTFAYDTLGNLKTITDPMKHATSYTYDSNGNKKTETDADQNTTTYGYDNMNHVTLITYQDNTTKSYTYDFRGNKLTATDQGLHTTKYVYDLAGQLTNVTYAYGTVDAGPVTYTYDLDGRRATVQDEIGNVTSNTYDAAGRLTTVTDALSHATNYGYDADDRQSSVQDANLNTTTYGYDVRSRLTTITYPIVPPATQATTTVYSYDGAGRVLTATDQAGKVTTNTYDDVGRLSTVTDAILPNPNVTKYFYDFAGNLRFLQDAVGRVTTYQYYPDNRKLSRQLPLNQLESYTYDPAGNLATKTDFNQKVTTYTYDTLNRLSTKVPDASLNQPTVTFTYTPTGQRLSMIDASGTTNYTVYDNRDRLKTKVSPEGTLNYTYDAHSNLKSIVSSNTNGASIAYNYDALNRLMQVCDNRIAPNCGAAGISNYSYDSVSNLASYTYPNAVQFGNVFDTQNRLAQTCAATTSPACSASQKLASFAYTLGNAGNRTNVAELNGRNVVYGYDNDYRLTSEAISSDPTGNNGSETYTYDAVGNRLTLNSTIPSLSGSIGYSYDDNDRLATDGYDANGNTITSGGISNTYDFENHMLTHGGVMMVYDGDGNRVSETVGSTTTKFLVDNKNLTGYSQVMDEIVNGSVTRTYAYGLQRISENQLVGSTWTPSFYGYDGHGNVRFLGNTAGTTTDTYEFDAFGAPIASTGTTPNPYLYSGERFDSSLNLYHLRARYYNMLTGRFLTMDPVQGKSCCRSASCSSKWASNSYAYGSDDPVNRIDPTGRAAAGVEYAIDLTPLIRIVELGAIYYLAKTITEMDEECELMFSEFDGTRTKCHYHCPHHGELCRYTEGSCPDPEFSLFLSPCDEF